MLVIPLVLYLLLVIYEFIPLYKQQLWRDFWVNFGLGICSFTYAIVIMLGWEVPSPTGPIQELIVSLFGK